MSSPTQSTPNTQESLTRSDAHSHQFSTLSIRPLTSGTELILANGTGTEFKVHTNASLSESTIQSIKDSFNASKGISDAMRSVIEKLGPSKAISALEVKGCEVNGVGLSGMSLDSFTAIDSTFRNCSFTMMKASAGQLKNVTIDSCTTHNFDASRMSSIQGVSFRNSRIDTIALPPGTDNSQVEARFRGMNLVGADFSKQPWFVEQVAAASNDSRELKKIFSKSLIDLRSTTFSLDATVQQQIAIGVTDSGTRQREALAPAQAYSAENLLSDLKLSAVIPTRLVPHADATVKELAVVSATQGLGFVSVIPPQGPSRPVITLMAEGQQQPLVNTDDAAVAAKQIFDWAAAAKIPQPESAETPVQQPSHVIRIAPHYEEVGFKERFVKNLPEDEIQKIAGIVQNMENNGAIPYGSLDTLSQDAQKSLQEFQELYALYKGSFPDPTETEEASAVWDHFIDPRLEWDCTVIKNDEGKTVAFSQGQVMNVDLPHSGEAIKVGWVEHTAVHPDHRGEGLGSIAVAAQINGHFKPQNAALAMVEIDNPYAIADDPAAFNHEDPKARGQFWENEGMAMDPFNRIAFWSSQGTGMLVMSKQESGEVMPVPYIQIAMSEGSAPCATLALSAIPLNEEMTQKLSGPGMHRDDFVAIYGALQGTIDEGYAERASFKTALEDMKSFQGNVKLHPYAPAGSRTVAPDAMDILERGAATRLQPETGDF
jgi:hypothetical protein